MALSLILIVFGCNSKLPTDKMVISVTILPQKHFVEKIAGDLVHVNVLVPPGTSPEFYSLMPSQMKELSESAAWLRIGKIGFEEGWIDKIRQNTPDLKIFDTSVQANWITGEKDTHEASDTELESPAHHEEPKTRAYQEQGHVHGIDPHIWSAPDEVKKIVTETWKALSSLIPDKKEILEQNYQAFMQEIDRLDQDLKKTLDPVKNRKFLIFHPALTYFARQYDLEQISLEVEGKEPSPRHMRSIIERARAEKIRLIFIQKEFDIENAQQLAREIDGEIFQIDPLSEQWEQQLRNIAAKIAAVSEE